MKGINPNGNGTGSVCLLGGGCAKVNSRKKVKIRMSSLFLGPVFPRHSHEFVAKGHAGSFDVFPGKIVPRKRKGNKVQTTRRRKRTKEEELTVREERGKAKNA